MAVINLVGRAVRAIRRKTLRALSIDAVTGLRFRPKGRMKRYGNPSASWMIPVSALGTQSVCYCAGCGEDISFDLDLITQFGCHVWGFDPTPRAIKYVKEIAKDQSLYRLIETGLWNEDTSLKFYAPANPSHVSHSALNLQGTSDFFVAEVRRLKTIMRDLGHSRIDLLKLDIEGAEYVVLKSLLEDNIDVRVLCVEFDEFFHPRDAQFRARIKAAVQQLLHSGFDLVEATGNGNYTFQREPL